MASQPSVSSTLSALDEIDLSSTDHTASTDACFRALLLVEFAAAVMASIWLAPSLLFSAAPTPYMLATCAIAGIGGVVSIIALIASIRFRGSSISRHLTAVAQILWCGLLGQMAGDQAQAFLFVFGSLAFLSFYRDYRLLVTATLVFATDQIVRSIVLPATAFGAGEPLWVQAAQHIGWVLLADVVLSALINASLRDTRLVAARQTELIKRHESMQSELERRGDALNTNEQLLRLSQERLDFALQATSEGFWDWDVRTGELYLSPAWHASLGYETTPQPATLAAWESLIHPDDLENWRRVLKDRIDGRSDAFEIEYRLRNSKDDYRWTLCRGRVAARDSENRATRIVGADADISQRKDHEKQLIYARRFLQNSIDSLNNHIAILDEEGVVVYVNRAWREFGQTFRDSKERRALEADYFSVCDDETLRQLLQEISNGTRESHSYKFCFQSPEGTRHFRGVATAFTEGEELRLAITHEDVTDLHLAERRIRDLARFPAENTNPVMRFDHRGKLMFANRASSPLQAYLNIKEGESIRGPLARHIRAAAVSGVQKQLEIESQGCRYQIELTPIEGAGYVNVYGRDITERHQALCALEGAKNAAEQANLAKSQFLANMSHEIRTPMTAILGFVEILLGNLEKEGNREAAETIRRNGEHLLGIINDILDLSKIEAGKFELEIIETSPMDLLSSIVELMRVRADAKGLELNVEFVGPMPSTIQTDPTRIRQVLINLVGNAVKFTETGSVTLRIELLGRETDRPMMEFRVSDTGMGMAEGALERIFNPFSQADSSMTRKHGGTGLGLTICRRFAEMLGGSVEVTSEIGVGTEFTVLVPTGVLSTDMQLMEALRKSQPLPLPKTPKPSNLQGARLLLAEDGPDNQRLISFILRKAGASVELAENGQVAVEKARESLATDDGPFDVILMDMQMPILDGYGAVRQLRNEGWSHPIVALTAHAMSGDRRRCVEAGCDDYATKPVNRTELIQMIAGYVDQAREKQPVGFELSTTTCDASSEGGERLGEDGP